MTRAVLLFIAVNVAIYGAISIVDLVNIHASARATVFQQLSAQLSVGLSILVVTVALGFSATIQRLQALTRMTGGEAGATPDAPQRRKGQQTRHIIAAVAVVVVLVVIPVFAMKALPDRTVAAPAASTGQVLTWTCPGGVTHIGPTAPMAGCSGR